MTFFGSTSNDACFNARVTEITTSENRGKVETALSVLPLFANVIVLLVAGIFGANAQLSDTQKSQISAGESTASFLKMPWFYFFLAFGLLMVIVGIVSLFLLEKDKIAPKKDTKYWSNLVYGFKPSVIKKNPKLYIALLGFMTTIKSLPTIVESRWATTSDVLPFINSSKLFDSKDSVRISMAEVASSRITISGSRSMP